MTAAGMVLWLFVLQDAHPVDRILEKHWKDKSLQPADPASDAEFIRRVTLDLIGVIPTPEEIRAFLSDERPDKRRRKVESLVGGQAFASYWAEKLTNDLMGYGAYYFDNGRIQFKAWLRQELREGATYSQIVRLILSANVTSKPGAFLRRWIFSDGKPSPEVAASRVSRLFLGVQLHCAQCHDHPFDRWTREDFFGFAGFFAGIALKGEMEYRFEESNVKAATFEGFKQPIPIRFLDGASPPGSWPRGELAQWVVSPRNPWFARAVANRMWAYLFGRGIIEPWDDLNAQAKPAVPGLLDALAKEFSDSGGDLRRLARLIATSHAYQLTSEAGPGSGDAFSRALVRPMLPEQLLNSLMRATGVIPRGSDYNEFKGEFANMFFAGGAFDRLAGTDLTTYRGTAQQILKMLDLDSTIYDGARVNGEGRLDRILAERKNSEDIIDEIYLAALSRPPTDRERDRGLKHLKKWDGFWNAYEDIFWALLNSNEFFFNH